MKTKLMLLLCLSFGQAACYQLFAQDIDTAVVATNAPVAQKKSLFGSKKDIVKKGLSFGPLPVVALDQDRGFQYGALVNIYDFGDGSHYPTPRQQWYIEASAYTKGTQQYYLTYDTKHLIPNIRMSVAASTVFDRALDFYGYNGYQAFYDVKNVVFWKNQSDRTGIKPEWMNAFYRVERLAVAAKADFVGNIWEKKLFWQGSYYFSWTRMRPINQENLNRGKDSVDMFSGKTLFEKYRDWGIIPASDGQSGITSALRGGIMYDTRDFEAAPSRGIWAEANLTIAPKWLGTANSYYRYNVVFRHYLPLVKEKLTFAYRLNYLGTLGNYLPYYIVPVYSTIGREYDRDGVGGYRSVRGISRDRVMGLDVAFFNAELRWKFVQFALLNQNVALGLNGFLDGGITTRPYDVSYRGDVNDAAQLVEYNKYVLADTRDRPHLAAGGGLRIIINGNFIIAVDYAKPFNRQDGTGSLYINTGYLF
jgi:hypothetical protein